MWLSSIVFEVLLLLFGGCSYCYLVWLHAFNLFACFKSFFVNADTVLCGFRPSWGIIITISNRTPEHMQNASTFCKRICFCLWRNWTISVSTAAYLTGVSISVVSSDNAKTRSTNVRFFSIYFYFFLIYNFAELANQYVAIFLLPL